MTDITLTFPDGSRRSYERGIPGRELAAAISKSLAKKAVAMLVDGRLTDLADPIAADATHDKSFLMTPLLPCPRPYLPRQTNTFEGLSKA